MDQTLLVTASPHIRDTSTTRGLMGNVLIALVPCVVASGLIFGYGALVTVAVIVASVFIFRPFCPRVSIDFALFHTAPFCCARGV